MTKIHLQPRMTELLAKPSKASGVLRVEEWAFQDDRGNTSTAIIEVGADNTVLVSYEILARLLSTVGGKQVQPV